MESTGSLLISQSKTHYRCYRVFIECLYRVYMESTWSLQGVCLLVKVKPITGVTGCLKSPQGICLLIKAKIDHLNSNKMSRESLHRVYNIGSLYITNSF